MPILWRYLLRNYLQVFFLCISGFISILLVTRFQNIARFAATGASKIYIFKFILLQIPFILPLAIPISCLIASLLLFRKMSYSHELTAIRTAGMSMIPISYPLLLCAIVMGLLNFTLVSEISPRCRGISKGLAYQMTAINPLCLLQKDTLIKLKNTYIDMKVLKSGKYAEDVSFIMRNTTNQRLGLMLAKKLELNGEQIIGNDVTFISSIDPKNCGCFDHLVIENQGEMQTGADQLTQYLRSSEWSIGYDYLNFRLLLAKSFAENAGIRDWKAYQEIARRLSLAIAAVVFTLVGIAWGMEISRERKTRGIVWSTCLMGLYLVSFVVAKSMKHSLGQSIAFYLIPLCLIFLMCLFQFRRVARGQM